MPPSLLSCPPEVVKQIVELLDLSDICSLRLSCVCLATKSIHRCFKAYFRTKYIDLTATSLANFVRITESGGPACLVQELHLSGILRESTDKTDTPELGTEYICDLQVGSDICLLTQAFNRLAEYSKDGILPSLSLRVEIIQANQERDLPLSPGSRSSKNLKQCTVKSAVNTFNTVIRALAASKLRIKRLDVFNAPDMQHCNLPCDQLNIVDWKDGGLASSFAALTTLCISISDRIFSYYEDEIGQQSVTFEAGEAKLRAASQDKNNFNSLANLLAICTSVSSIDLHYNHIYYPAKSLYSAFLRQNLLQHVVQLGRLPSLKQCRLQGFSVTQVDLLEFIQRTCASEISLEHIRLQTGTLRPIIDYCTGEPALITRLYLNTIYEKIDNGHTTGLVHFVGEGESIKYEGKFDYGSEILDRQSESVRNAITYFVPRPMPEGSPSIYRWNRQQQIEYGCSTGLAKGE